MFDDDNFSSVGGGNGAWRYRKKGYVHVRRVDEPEPACQTVLGSKMGDAQDLVIGPFDDQSKITCPGCKHVLGIEPCGQHGVEAPMGKGIRTLEELRAVLNNITFGPSGVMLDKMDLKWEIEGLIAQNGSYMVVPSGWKIRFTFLRPDTATGTLGRGAGRWELVEIGTSETGIVNTCWLLLELLVRHELMEAFKYCGVRISDPHATVEQRARAVRDS